MVVAGRVGREVTETMESDCVLGGREPKSGSVAGNLARGDIVRGLTTKQKAVTANDGVSGKGGSLEDINDSARVEAGLLPDSVDERRLAALVREERGVHIELEALGNLVLELNLGAG